MAKIRIAGLLAVVALVATLASGIGTPTSRASVPSTGNGAPSGWHVTLNIHGVAQGQGFTNSDSAGNNIFAPLWGNCKIELQKGPFAVLNSDCVNENAQFQLPDPDNGSGMLAYSVYVRALTKGSASLTSCFTDTTTNESFCNAGTLVVPLNKVTPPKFTNVSKDLLQVCVNGSLQPLFSNASYDYYWDYDNQGLRLAQLRFYPIETTPIGGGCTSTVP